MKCFTPAFSYHISGRAYDCVLGLGLDQDNPKAQHPETWRGQNLLGFALMDVRDALKNRSEP